MKVLTKWSNTLMEKYLPDPYVFVAILTFFVLIFGLIFTDSTPMNMVTYWGEGFWGLLAFTMQMVVVLAAGHVLANSPIFKKILSKLASKVKTPGRAIIIVSFVSIIACWINWGFGLVIGALFAKEIARQVSKVDYRLLIASAYSGFVVWHGGLAGSVPLSIATEGHPFAEKIGVIPTTETIFSSYNLFIVIVIILTLPFFNRWMMPKEEETVAINLELLKDEEAVIEDNTQYPNSFANRSETSIIITVLIGALGLAYLIWHFLTNGFDLNLNVVNMIFVILGILFHGTPRKFLAAVNQAIKTTGGIVFQFPFYAGIMGMMTASGLAGVISEWFISISNETTFPLLTFLSAGIVNIFVPSGGGQWAVQAPIMLDAAKTLGVDYAKTAMAIAWGDAWTNMIQPFWALPALAIAGLKAKDIMGFCVFVLLFTGIIISLGFLIF